MAVASTGFFDGVHLGHRAVIEALLKTASERGEQSLVITFARHPRLVLQQDARSLRLLTSAEEKKALLEAMGVDKVVVLDFNRQFAAMSAAQYVEMLRADYEVTSLVLGYDNRIGSDLLGAEDVGKLIPTTVVDARQSDSEPVSSTRIRKALACSDVEGAAQMLGRAYTLTGVVVSGNQMGRTIGFPTANMRLREPLKQVPGVGAYLSRVDVGGRHFFGMTNIDHNAKIETHIFDFSEDIYGLDITVSFEKKIRDEIHFESFSQLKDQLHLDKASAILLAKDF